MSFTINQERLYLPLKPLKVSEKGNIVNHFVDMKKKIESFHKGNSPGMTIYIKINIPMDKQTGNISFDVEFVESAGKQVGFYGNIIDMDSGDILLENYKSPNFIRLGSFTEYMEHVLELKGRTLSWSMIKYHLEQFKLYGTDLYGFFEGVYNEAKGVLMSSDDTFTKTKLSDSTSGVLDEFTVELYGRCLTRMERFQKHMSLIFNPSSVFFSTAVSDSILSRAHQESTINNEKDYGYLVDFMGALGSLERKEMGGDVFEVDYEMAHKVGKRGDSRDNKANERMLYLSALPSYRSQLEYLHLGEKPSKSSLIAMNFIDILDVAGEREYEDFYQMTEEGDLDDLKDLTERLGIEDIVKGSKLTAIKKGVQAEAEKYHSQIYSNIVRRSNMTGRKRPNQDVDTEFDYSQPPREDYVDFGEFGGLKGVKYDVESFIHISRFIDRINKILDSIG